MNFYANIIESKGPVVGDKYFLQTKEEIKDWLDNFQSPRYSQGDDKGIENYTINDDLTVDVDGDVALARGLKKGKIPVKFRKVTGDFYCEESGLKSLKGCPDYLGGRKMFAGMTGGNFDCSRNNLTNLDYFPKILMGKNVYIYDNPLTTLKGLTNISDIFLMELRNDTKYYPKLNWKEIEWDKVENIDEVLDKIFEHIENDWNANIFKKVLIELEKAGAY